MRVSTRQQFDMYLSNIQSSNQRYLEAQKQVMTGKKFDIASESPGDAQFVISANSIRSRVDQLNKNLRGANDYLKNTDAAFTELNTIVNSAYSVAVSGASSTYDQASRDGMAKQISEIQKRIVSLANSRGASNQFIFAGQKTDAQPFTETPPTLTYNGDDNPINVEIRPGETMRVNLQGSGQTFTQMYSTLETLKNDLMSGNTSLISSQDIKAVQDQLTAINAVRGDVGTKLQTVTALATQNQRRMDDLKTQVSDVQEVDLSQAITSMQLAQNAYSAALEVTAKGQGLSLMDYLR